MNSLVIPFGSVPLPASSYMQQTYTKEESEAQLDYLLDRATFTVEATPEEESPEESFSSGDEDCDRETCKSIREQLECGNEWGWCCVRVTASFGGASESEYLGCCSYDSEEDFRLHSGYFAEMKREAAAALLVVLRENRDALAGLWA